MKIIANGQSFELADGTSLPDFIRARGLAPGRVVVERNGEALTPSETLAAVLSEGDRLEIVRIVAGG